MTKKRVPIAIPMLIVSTLCITTNIFAAEEVEDAAELAKKLANPIASLISLPLQYNFDHNLGPENKGHKSVLNIQPVIPISIDEEWNVISRTIVPLIDQNHMPGNKSGNGDVLQSLFFSPKKSTEGGVIWGAGPVLSIPTASDELLGSEKWSAGPRYWAESPEGSPEDWGFRVQLTFLFPK